MNHLRRIIYNILIQLAITLFYFILISFLVVLYLYLCDKGFNLIELIIKLQTIPPDQLPEWIPTFLIDLYKYVQKNFVPCILIPFFIRNSSTSTSVNHNRYILFFMIIWSLNAFFLLFPFIRIIDILIILLYNVFYFFLDPYVFDPFFNVLIIYWHNLFIPFLLCPILFSKVNKKFIIISLLILIIIIYLFYVSPF